jgi:protein-tyrosine-phosphatase
MERLGVDTAADRACGSLGANSILFVCTGNTCRSPLAAALCKSILARRLQCSPADLPAFGYSIESAGLAALPGQPATPEAVFVASELGADLTSHQSRPLTAELLGRARRVFAMTRNHVQVLLDYFPDLRPAPQLLSTTGIDLDDPIGCDLSVYRACAQAIQRNLDLLLPELHDSIMKLAESIDSKAGAI